MCGGPRWHRWVASTYTFHRIFLIFLVIITCAYISIHSLYTRPRLSKPVRSQSVYISMTNQSQQRFPIDPPTERVLPMLTLFTSWPHNESRTKRKLRDVTLVNWARLKPTVMSVFFSDSGSNMNISTQYIVDRGWKVLPVRQTSKSGIPVLKSMFLDVMDNFKSVYYGYANGDILFDNGLLETLAAAHKASLPPGKPILIVGQRTNVKNVTMKEVANSHNLTAVAKRGSLFTTMAEDYFFTDSSFPWAEVPGMVIGRRAYDNWLVLNSRKQSHTVIDSTLTMLAVHQTTSAGDFEGFSHHDSNYNSGLLFNMYRNIAYREGRTICSSWITKKEKANNSVVIVRRENLVKGCQ